MARKAREQAIPAAIATAAVGDRHDQQSIPP
jgi:hypothetical protein